MTVKELIKHLRTFPQDLPIAFSQFSEYRLMDSGDVAVKKMQPARKDGWVHSIWPGEPALPEQPYVVFPGN